MPTRHALPATPRTARVTGTADRVTLAPSTQKARRGNAGPSLAEVGHSPIPGVQADRKGVAVVSEYRPTHPARTRTAPRVPAEVAA